MTLAFDMQAINHMTVAICREMTPQGRDRHPQSDTLFMGGARLTDADQHELGLFGMRKNYKIVHASFDTADPMAGAVAFHAVVTDGVADCLVISEGRLWKRDRRSAAVLLFPGLNGVVKLSTRGRMIVKEMTGAYHEDGYALAREAVLARAARKPGHMPVVSPIGTGGLITVTDVRTLSDTFAAAA